MKLAAPLLEMNALTEPHTLIWVMTLWAFLPANLIIRGVALNRVADIIEEKRRRTYAEARSEESLQTA